MSSVSKKTTEEWTYNTLLSYRTICVSAKGEYDYPTIDVAGPTVEDIVDELALQETMAADLVEFLNGSFRPKWLTDFEVDAEDRFSFRSADGSLIRVLGPYHAGSLSNGIGLPRFDDVAVQMRLALAGRIWKGIKT